MDTLDVGDNVLIDQRGSATVISVLTNGYYRLQVDGTEFKFDCDEGRLLKLPCGQSFIIETPSSSTAKQTTNTKPKDAQGRFVAVEDGMIDGVILDNQNKNTAKKTLYDLKLFDNFLNVQNEFRQMHEIPPNELDTLLCKFSISVRKTNWENYEPNSLTGFQSSIERSLKRRGYGYSLTSSLEFSRSREVLKGRKIELKKEGRGNLPRRADPIGDEEIEALWQSGSIGISNPMSIINCQWLYNTINFGLRGVNDHNNMCWGDITLHVDGDDHEYLELSMRQEKNRSGENPRDCRDVRPKMWANVADPSRCPVQVYKLYASTRPLDFCRDDDPFYIGTQTLGMPKPGDQWFIRYRIGKNKLSSLMKNMCDAASLQTSKRLTNHSARKLLVQKLNDNNVPPNDSRHAERPLA
ncbi:zinc finger MYM-type protein 2-like [Haliotis rufescens]|uniref:zinc finger MYM-type protein 2-like n=1 Tax=Haliotis rufescens TaxID=6454 RepID=UPI00201F5C42|nr:zinc finger MYM-type protein 2-like [Haliotis rufescens]